MSRLTKFAYIKKENVNMRKNLGAKAIAFPTPVCIVSTYGKDNKPNAMNVAWGGMCSSEPPCIMIAIRKGRYTYENIIEREAFTVNFPDVKHVKEADLMGLVSGRKADKFKLTGLTAVRSEFVDAPVILEFPFALECKAIKNVEIGQHVMFVGEILNATVKEACLTDDGVPDIKKIDPLTYDPVVNAYNAIGDAVDKAFSAGVGFLPQNR